jgi:putative ABC transport system ATP-binding protein
MAQARRESHATGSGASAVVAKPPFGTGTVALSRAEPEPASGAGHDRRSSAERRSAGSPVSVSEPGNAPGAGGDVESRDAGSGDARSADQAVVDLEGVRFRWRGSGPDVLVLDRLRVARGERLFIEGPSGSGKSTLLGLLAGVTVPRLGSVRVLGQSLEALDGPGRDHFRAHHIGYIFQMFNLIPYLSIIENVTLPCRFSVKRRERARRRSADLATEARRLLGHLDLADPELLARPVNELSVGQQQRVAAARALMGSPEILIADEPTSSLDADRRQAFVRLLFEECAEAGSTLIFVSHDASLEPLFDRTLRLAEVNAAGAAKPAG